MENQSLRSVILQIYAACDKRLGAYKIAKVLERDYGIHISIGRVYRLMKSMELPKMSTKKPGYRKVSNDQDAVNYLEQKFHQKAPNQVWVSDITYIRAGGAWQYLCVILDLFSRKVIAWEVAAHADTDLVIRVFRRAWNQREKPQGLMFHSDRGTQYTAVAFRSLLDELNVVQSFSRKGYPYDNAVAESFFKYLKQEETNRRVYPSRQDLQTALFEYIEGFYNTRRPHGSLAYLTPVEAEEQYDRHRRITV